MEKFVIALAVCSITMTLVAAIYALLSARLKKIQSSKWRYYTWVLIFIGFIVLFKPDFGGAAVTVELNEYSGPVFTVGEKGYMVDMLYNKDLYSLIFSVWLIGFLVKLGVILHKQYSFYKSIKRLSKPVTRSVKEKANGIAADLGTAADFKVVTINEISSPMITGFFKSLLILPDRHYSEKELHLILKHELVHLKHYDLFIKAFMLLCGALHWFNPFIRFFIRFAEREGELYCDETVMSGESGEMKKLYCQSILNTASVQERVKYLPAISSNFVFNKEDLKHRMEMILSFNKKYSLGIICACILILTLCTGTAIAFSDTRGDLGSDGNYAGTTIFANTADTELSPAETTFKSIMDEIATSASSIPANNTDAEVSYTFITQP